MQLWYINAIKWLRISGHLSLLSFLIAAHTMHCQGNVVHSHSDFISLILHAHILVMVITIMVTENLVNFRCRADRMIHMCIFKQCKLLKLFFHCSNDVLVSVIHLQYMSSTSCQHSRAWQPVMPVWWCAGTVAGPIAQKGKTVYASQIIV